MFIVVYVKQCIKQFFFFFFLTEGIRLGVTVVPVLVVNWSLTAKN